MIVMKFGGSSLASADAIDRVAAIVASHAEARPLVVVSAMGKTTDRLLSIARTAADGNRDEANKQVEELKACHLREAQPVVPKDRQQELEATANIERVFIAAASNTPAAHADLACIAARDLERSIVRLKEHCPEFDAEHILSYVNRLSDFLFVLARHLEDGNHNQLDYDLLDDRG